MDRISHKYLRPPNQIVRNSEFLSSFPFFGGGDCGYPLALSSHPPMAHPSLPPSTALAPSNPTAHRARREESPLRESRADTCVYSSPAKQRKEAHINCAYHNCMWDGRDGDGDLLRVVAASGRWRHQPPAQAERNTTQQRTPSLLLNQPAMLRGYGYEYDSTARPFFT